MNWSDQENTIRLGRSPEETTTARLKPPAQNQLPRRVSLSRWLFPAVALLIGIVVGAVGVVLYALSIAGDKPVAAVAPPAQNSAMVAQVHTTFLQQLVEKNINSAGLPGKVQNVQIVLSDGDLMTVTGDDQLSILGLGFTRHFTVELQPVVNSCQLSMHIIHADLQSIQVTGFTASFEDRLNQQLQLKLSGLPEGFNYCVTGVRTQPSGLEVSYSATPV